MPQVPRYEPNQVREELRPAQTMDTRTSAETFGGGRSLDRLTDTLSRSVDYIDKVKQEADEVYVQDLDNQAALLQKKTEVGYKNLQGKDAFGSQELIDKEWSTGIEAIYKQTKNSRQREMFDRRVKARKLMLDTGAMEHVSAQAKAYDDEQTTAAIQIAQDDAVENYKDPERVGLALMKQEADIRKHGERHGVSPEVLENNIAEAKSKTHVGILSRYVNSGEDLSAKKYFEDNRESFNGTDLVKAEALVEEGSLRGESQRQADKIYASSDNMTSALDRARSIEEPKLRDETIRRIKERYSEKKAAEDMDIEDLHRRSVDLIEKTGSTETIPRQDWMRFSVNERNSLLAYAKSRAMGLEPQTDSQVYYDLMNMASGPQVLKEKFLRTNLAAPDYRTKLNDADWKQMVKLQSDLRAGKGDKDGILDGYRSDSMIVNDALSAAGFDPTPKPGSKDAEKVALFRARVDETIKRQQQQTGKKVTNDDIQGIVDRLLIQGDVPESGIFGMFKTQKRAFELEPGEAVIIEPSDIPRLERIKIENALKANNMPVTEENIYNLYMKKYGNNK